MKAQPKKETQFVPVIEADVLDRMNETRDLIARRAYEIYESRGGDHGHHEDDWRAAEQEILPQPNVECDVVGDEVRFAAEVPGFEAKDLEVLVGHNRAVVCGVHHVATSSALPTHRERHIIEVAELPCPVRPAGGEAILENGRLHVHLPLQQPQVPIVL